MFTDSASKFAVQSYFDCLRAEVAEHNIHIGIVSPSYVQTNLSMNAVCADNSQHGSKSNIIFFFFAKKMLCCMLVTSLKN